MKKWILVNILLLLIPLSVNALVFGGSNLGVMGYPSHDCSKPTEPFKPYSSNSQWEIDSYNSDVELYNSQLQQYTDCIDEFVENAKNDINQIKEKAQKAIDESNY